ncbi:ABC transporter [Striga asiatica]|uniref:ABC transporter n=1 Tax=Striga asiatica TaxID=4170 RepID=A0A5A7QE28_STRAF|nr:ABC transporter [Striga asiatica]
MDPVPWFDNFLWNHDLPMIMGCEWSKISKNGERIRKTQIISKAALQSMLNQATKDSSTAASARIGVGEHLTNQIGIPQTLEAPNPNQNLNAAEGSTGNLQDTSVTGSEGC